MENLTNVSKAVISWTRVMPAEDGDEILCESGWYCAGGWYLDDDPENREVIELDEDYTWSDLLAEYGAEFGYAGARWAIAENYDEDFSTGAVTTLHIHPVTE